MPIVLSAYSHENVFQDQDVRAAVDNLSIRAGEIDCPTIFGDYGALRGSIADGYGLEAGESYPWLVFDHTPGQWGFSGVYAAAGIAGFLHPDRGAFARGALVVAPWIVFTALFGIPLIDETRGASFVFVALVMEVSLGAFGGAAALMGAWVRLGWDGAGDR